MAIHGTHTKAKTKEKRTREDETLRSHLSSYLPFPHAHRCFFHRPPSHNHYTPGVSSLQFGWRSSSVVDPRGALSEKHESVMQSESTVYCRGWFGTMTTGRRVTEIQWKSESKCTTRDQLPLHPIRTKSISKEKQDGWMDAWTHEAHAKPLSRMPEYLSDCHWMEHARQFQLIHAYSIENRCVGFQPSCNVNFFQ